MNKLSDKAIVKARTDSSAYAILEITKDIDISSLLSDIFVYTDNPIAKEMIKRYETQLLLSNLNPEKFSKGLHSFYQKTYEYIKGNKLEKEFMSFFYFIISVLSVKKNILNENATFAYFDILVQQFDYFKQPSRVICGINSNDKWISVSDPFPYFDAPSILLNKYKNPTKVDLIRIYKEYGYDVKNEDEILYYRFNDQLIGNMMKSIANFINEDTFRFIPSKFYMVAGGFSMPKSVNNSDTYKELLTEKAYFLPHNGVNAILKNSNEISEILFQEIFSENRIILLYKVLATNKKEFCGFYDNKLQYFYSPFKDTSHEKKFHNPLENFILETYCHLTTDIDKSDLDLIKRIEIVDSFENVSNDHPAVKFLYEENNEIISGKKEKSFRIFEKSKYRDNMIKISPYIRKLPMGYKASDEAKTLANEYGYVIRSGETFVKPFDKKIYKKI